jgi:chromate transporter
MDVTMCASVTIDGRKRMKKYINLLLTMLKIGLFTFGGGYAMIALLENEFVEKKKYMDKDEFLDMVAIAESTPGPIAINSATYIGYTVAGFWGSVVATLAVSLPAMTLMILITRFYLQLRSNRFVASAMATMRPVVIGMIGAAALLLMFPETQEGASFIDGWSWVLFIAAMVAAYKKVNPILLIVLSAVAGVAIYYLPTIL